MTDAANQGGMSHPPRLFQLDALRGIAAMVILLFHLDLVYRIRGPFVRGYAQQCVSVTATGYCEKGSS